MKTVIFKDWSLPFMFPDELPLHGCLSLPVYSASKLLVLFNDSILRKGLRRAFPVVSFPVMISDFY